MVALPVIATVLAEPPRRATAETLSTSDASLAPAQREIDREMLAQRGQSVRSAGQTAAAQQAAAAQAAEQAAAAAATAQQAAEAQRAAAEQAAAQRASRATRAPLASSSDPKSIALAMLTARGQGSQFSCLDKLWTRESNWSVSAANRSSGAYGIPQALPGSKMASAGGDWRSNPATQITWGLDYISARYGSPCSAWSHSQSSGWY